MREGGGCLSCFGRRDPEGVDKHVSQHETYYDNKMKHTIDNGALDSGEINFVILYCVEIFIRKKLGVIQTVESFSISVK